MKYNQQKLNARFPFIIDAEVNNKIIIDMIIFCTENLGEGTFISPYVAENQKDSLWGYSGKFHFKYEKDQLMLVIAFSEID